MLRQHWEHTLQPPPAPLAGGSSHAPRAAPPPRRSAPAPGAARLSLGLDLRLRMGERSASGVPGGDASGRAPGKAGGAISNGMYTRSGVRHPSAAHTSLLSPRAIAELRAYPNG